MKLFHPTATGCSYDGKSYKGTADKDGVFVFDVPEGAVDLLSHGFSTSRPDPAADKAKEQGVNVETHNAVGDQLTEARQALAELEGKVAALISERDALVAKLPK